MSTNPYPRGGASLVVKNPHDYVPNREGDADGSVMVGEALTRTADGFEAGAEDGARFPLFAGIPFDPEKTKGDEYDDGERMKILVALPGMILDLVYAAGEDITENAFVVLDDEGRLREYDDTDGDVPADIFGQAAEDVDTTAGGTDGPANFNVEVF